MREGNLRKLYQTYWCPTFVPSFSISVGIKKKIKFLCSSLPTFFFFLFIFSFVFKESHAHFCSFPPTIPSSSFFKKMPLSPCCFTWKLLCALPPHFNFCLRKPYWDTCDWKMCGQREQSKCVERLEGAYFGLLSDHTLLKQPGFTVVVSRSGGSGCIINTTTLIW